MQSQYTYFVGVDWATEAHEINIIDKDRTEVAGRSFDNTAQGLHDLCTFLETTCGKDRDLIAIAIEVPRGALVETLVERGFHVYSVNPKQLDRFRDRHTVAGSKDDRLDAFVLGDSLRTDMPCFRRVKFDEPDMIILRGLSRVDNDLAESRNRLMNQLREQLMRYAPHFLKLCPSADETWFWELFEIAADPEEGQRLKLPTFRSLLSRHRIRRLTAEHVAAVVMQTPLTVAPGTIPAAITHGRVVIAQLRVVDSQMRSIRKQIDDLMGFLSQRVPETKEHRDAAILLSLPGVGNLVAATMLSEASQSIAERDHMALRAHAGIAPITKRSGKRLHVIMRQACNQRLRNAVYHWARVSVQKDPTSRNKYATLRTKGHSHGRALRSVADSLLRLLFGMLKSKTVFDPPKRLAVAHA